jgi:TonB-dependent receptor
MRRYFFRSLAVLVCALLAIGFAPSVFGQAGKGSIAGRVADTGGGVLQGADITIDPGGVKAASDNQGKYLVNGLNPGSYTVTIAFLGFSSAVKTVAVTTGQVATADVQLGVASQNLEVLVTAERATGEAEEVNRQLTADNVVQVLTSDVIRSLPNANMADALGRLPSVTLERDEGEGKYVQVRGTEPRLTNLTIDGVEVPSPESGVRQIKLDAIPADIVESVEINKTLQANMNGDGIGGSVNLVTKTAGERPTVNLSGMGGYTPIIHGRGLVETTGTVGQRWGLNKRFGALIGGSYDWNGRGINDMEPSPDAINNNGAPGAPFPDNADLRSYRYYRTRWGLSGSLDYKLAEGSNLYFNGFYSDFKNYGDRWVYNISDNTPNVNLINGSGGNPTFNASIRRPDYGIGVLVAGGHHVFSSTWYSWDVSAARSRQLERGDPQANFVATPAFDAVGSSCQYNQAGTTNIFHPQWSPSCFTEIDNPANFQLSNFDLLAHGLSAQLNLQIAGAGAKRYHIGSRLATIEVGGLYRNAHKFDNSFGTNEVPLVPLSLAMFTNNVTNPDYYGGGYALGPFADWTKVMAYFNANPGQFMVNPKRGQAGPGYNLGNYDLLEKVGAGYFMNTLDITNRIRLVAGLRFENTVLDTAVPACNGNAIPCTGGLTFSSGSYLKALPSASLRFGLGADTDLRLAYSRGLGRPDPTDIAQAASVTFVGPGSVGNTATLGNTNLKAETADNIDLLVEHSLKPFGQISGGVFYKNITQPIVNTTIAETFTPPSNLGPTDTYRVTQFINGGSARVIGFEVAYLQHFTFLPGMLGGFGLSANYGYTDSRIGGLPGRSDHPRLLRSAPNTWNISPTYDRGRLSVRAGFSYNEANIFSYQFHDGAAGGINGPNGDNYLYSHLEIDIQGSYRLAHGLSFVMYGLDLNNEVFGFYNGSTSYFNQREYYRPTIAAGFRWSPIREH